MTPRLRRSRPGRQAGVTNAQVAVRHAAMAEMHRAGASVADIARHFGCAWKTVDAALSKPRVLR